MGVYFHISDDVSVYGTGYMYNRPGGFRKPVYKWTLLADEEGQKSSGSRASRLTLPPLQSHVIRADTQPKNT